MIDPASFDPLHVTVSDDGQRVELRLNHGKANEIGLAVLDALARFAAALESDPDVRAWITWSDQRSRRGTPIFVAGADVAERRGWTKADVLAHVDRQRTILTALRRVPVFHAVVVDGVAFGWGTEFLLTADHVSASPGARFALPETGLGIVPGAGGTGTLWSRIGPRAALWLGMTGEPLDPARALSLGLVDHLADDAAGALAEARRLAARAATRSPTANAAFKRAVLDTVDAFHDDAATREADAYARCVHTGEAAIGREHFDAIRSGAPVPWGPRTP